MKDGPMDSQDVVAWGRPRPDKYFSERERLEVLCDWGRPFGLLDGFVRMECHLTQTPPLDRPNGPQLPPPPPYPRPEPPPPGWRGSLLSEFISFFEAQVAVGWHDRAPGETNVHLDYSGLVAFYDTTLYG
ncbi:hypothetical protein BC827DRAFT_1383282 [Russula dissimulans]|nr:hypothetical protein BC827DRAFT_1383282 [Russula dissimulans]